MISWIINILGLLGSWYSTNLESESILQNMVFPLLCRRRVAIESIIGHMKADCRLSRNWLTGCQGDASNIHIAAYV